MNKKRLDWDFKYHTPLNDTQRRKHEQMRAAVKAVADYMNTMLDDSREKSLAITKLEEALFWANACIARNPRPDEAK